MQPAQVQVPTEPLEHTALGKVLNLSMPQVLTCKMGIMMLPSSWAANLCRVLGTKPGTEPRLCKNELLLSLCPPEIPSASLSTHPNRCL